MKICQLCTSPRLREADARLLAGQSQRSVARWLGLDYQVVGRHARNGHVRRGNAAAGAAWTKPEPAELGEDLDDEAYQAVFDAVGALAFAVHGIGPDVLAAHAGDKGDDGCPACRVEADPSMDWLMDRVLEYRASALT